jgi:hypothetical protein
MGIGLLLWPAWVIMFILVGMLVDFDEDADCHWIGGTVMSAVWVIISIKLFSWDPVAIWRAASYTTMLQYIVAYMLIGTVWSFIRFYISARNAKKNHTDKNMLPHVYRKLVDRVPAWIAFWIPSMVWTALADMVQPLFEWISARLTKVYQWLFKKATGQVME